MCLEENSEEAEEPKEKTINYKNRYLVLSEVKKKPKCIKRYTVKPLATFVLSVSVIATPPHVE